MGSDALSYPVVGVFGKCCAGKDLVTRWLTERGWQEINVDHAGHEALHAEHDAVCAAFGAEILMDPQDPTSPIDRGRLGARVFRDRRERARLEAIIHPPMVAAVTERVAAARTTSPVVINAALLIPMNLHVLCDTVVLVQAPLLRRLQRARERDSHRMSVIRMLRRVWAQRGLHTQAIAGSADIITVENGGTVAQLFASLDTIPQLQEQAGEPTQLWSRTKS